MLHLPSKQHPNILLEFTDIARFGFYFDGYGVSFFGEAVYTGRYLYIFSPQFLYLFFDTFEGFPYLFGIRHWEFNGKFGFFGRTHTQVLYRLGDYELVRHENHCPFFVDEFRVGEGYLLYHSLVPLDFDGVVDLEIVAEYKGKASEQVGDEFFAGEREQHPSDPRSGYECIDVDPEGRQDI